jgi:hypothetical protein
MISHTFFIDLFIDTVQNTKSFWVDTLIKEESIKKPLQEFITAQTIYTKKAYSTAIEYISKTMEYIQK